MAEAKHGHEERQRPSREALVSTIYRRSLSYSHRVTLVSIRAAASACMHSRPAPAGHQALEEEHVDEQVGAEPIPTFYITGEPASTMAFASVVFSSPKGAPLSRLEHFLVCGNYNEEAGNCQKGEMLASPAPLLVETGRQPILIAMHGASIAAKSLRGGVVDLTTTEGSLGWLPKMGMMRGDDAWCTSYRT